MARESFTNTHHRHARWSWLFAGGGVLLVLTSISSARETYQGWKVNQEIHGLRAQVEALEGRRVHLTETLARLQAPDAVDREARVRLGLQKPGEQVFVLREPGTLTASLDHPALTASTDDEQEEPNTRKWFRYFFHPAL